MGIISLSGLVGGIFWPLLNDPNKKKTVMRLLLGLATGSLSSSAVFQLLPEVSGGNIEEKKKYILFFRNTNTYVKSQAFKIPEAFPDYKYTALIMWLSLCGLYTIETSAGIFFHNDEKKVYGFSNRFMFRFSAIL